MKQADLLITGGTVITMDEERQIIENGTVAVTGDTFAAVGTEEEFRGRYTGVETIDARSKYVFPGFITTHTHLFQTLLKGLGRDKTLFDWLNSSVRVALHNYTEECMYYGAMTGLIEAIRTGTTMVTDSQYCHVRKGFDEPVIRAYRELGVRGVLSKCHTDVSGLPPEIRPGYVESEDDYFQEMDDLCSRFADDPMLSMSLAPGIIWDHSKEGFIETRNMADRYKIPITMHLLETEDDDRFSMERYGKPAVDVLEECGILGPDFVSVHSVHMSESDFDTFIKYGVSVCHCPVSNMVLASGAAPVPRFLREGMTVSLACDGAASNDTQDMLEVLKITALQHKLMTRDAATVSAARVLEMATLHGARALLKGKEIGSIEEGKKADMFIFNPLRARSVPLHDPVSTIVYSAGQTNVETTVINGKVVMKNGEITVCNEEEILRKTQNTAAELVEKSGLGNVQWGRTVQGCRFP